MFALLFDELMKNRLSVHFKKTFNNYVYVHTVHFVLFIIHTNKCTNIYIKIY